MNAMTNKKTALFDEHKKLSAKMVDFGGWDLPIQYTGVIGEHLNCRKNAALFDVSHMGEIEITGEGAEAFLNFLITNDITKIQNNQAQYTVMCLESGGIVDDLIVYKKNEKNYFLVVNASNTEKDFDHILNVYAQYRKHNLTIVNKSSSYTQIAIQGPKAQQILQKITKINLSEIKYYHFLEGEVLNAIPSLIANTGYTGESGFELYIPWESGPQVWSELLTVGSDEGIKPCGLGARDTLRLEMKFPLYGHELSDTTNPLESGLSWVVKFNKDAFVGKDALMNIKASGINKSLIGLKVLDRGIPRQGYKVFSMDDEHIGDITSGTQSPSLGYSIAIASVQKNYSEIGQKLKIQIRDNKILSEVISTPFYKRGKTK